jgi:hypothetical protein
VVKSGGSVNRFWGVGWSGFAGICRYNNKQIENHPNKATTNITTTKKLTITKHNNNKSANTPILDRTGEGEADATAESTRSGQNSTRSRQIR